MAVKSEVLSASPTSRSTQDRVAMPVGEPSGGAPPLTRIGGRSTGHRSIPPGGVTPDELRNAHLREAFRGYHRDHVDALCERAAETIEHLERRCGDLEERLRHVLELQGSTAGSTAPPAAPVEPLRSREVARDTAREVDVVQRTLVLAQQAADEAVAEAQSRAVRLVDDAEAKSTAMLTEAESTARRIADQERTRVATEVAELDARRRTLQADVDVLERFTDEYRERIHRAIESELGRLGGSAVAAVIAPSRPLLLEGTTELPSTAPAAPSAPSAPAVLAAPAAEDPPDPEPPVPFALGPA